MHGPRRHWRQSRPAVNAHRAGRAQPCCALLRRAGGAPAGQRSGTMRSLMTVRERLPQPLGGAS